MTDSISSFQLLVSGLSKLTPSARKKLLGKLEPNFSDTAELLEKVIAGKTISVDQQEALLADLEKHWGEVIKQKRQENATWKVGLSEGVISSEISRLDPSAETRGGKKPGLDFYDNR